MTLKKSTKKPVKKVARKRRAPLTEEQKSLICLQRAIDQIEQTDCLVLIEVGKDGLTRIRHHGPWASAVGAASMALTRFLNDSGKTFKTFDPIKGDR